MSQAESSKHNYENNKVNFGRLKVGVETLWELEKGSQIRFRINVFICSLSFWPLQVSELKHEVFVK